MSALEATEATFAINACDRCRKRKARCDPGIPSCQNCQNAGSICAYTDARIRNTQPRSQIIDLEEQIAHLEAQIRQLSTADVFAEGSAGGQNLSSSTSAQESGEEDHYPDLIRLESGGDGHFLGASSGLNLARSVLESARRGSAAFDDHESSAAPGDSQGAEATEDQAMGSEDHAVDVKLPSWESVTKLMDVYFHQYEIQYPILERQEFMKDVTDLYNGRDPLEGSSESHGTIFMLSMVLSVALMSSDDPTSEKLSDAFRRSATARLNHVMQTKNHKTLQCLLLLLLSSTLGSKSAPMWYISGICMRMCVDLGYHTERMIRQNVNDQVCGGDLDTKRRLFWVTYTFDRSLAKMLGRPFFIRDDKIDVQYPTTSLPRHLKAPIHLWLAMQKIQSEIVSEIYVLTQPVTQSPTDAAEASRYGIWKTEMNARLTEWLEATKRLGACGRYTSEWWEYWYQHARLMLNQPKPSATKDSLLEALGAAETMVRLSFIRAHRSVVEFTWLDIHLQLVSGLTLLFLVLKSSSTREHAKRDWVRFKGCVIEWQVVLEKLAKRWRSMVKMKSVLGKIADAVLDSIENDKLPKVPGYRRRTSSTRDRRHTRLAFEDSNGPLQPAQGTRSPKTSTEGQQSSRKQQVERNSGATPTIQIEDTPPSIDSQDLGEAGSVYPHLNAPDYGGAVDNIDFPSMLGGDLLADIDQLGAPLQLDLGLFNQHMDWMPSMGEDPFAFQWLGGRPDATLTDSVLNFQGDFEVEPGQENNDSQFSDHLP